MFTEVNVARAAGTSKAAASTINVTPKNNVKDKSEDVKKNPKLVLQIFSGTLKIIYGFSVSPMPFRY